MVVHCCSKRFRHLPIELFHRAFQTLRNRLRVHVHSGLRVRVPHLRLLIFDGAHPMEMRGKGPA